MRVSHTLLCAALVGLGTVAVPVAATAATDSMVAAVARDLGIDTGTAAVRLRQQDAAHEVAERLPAVPHAGMWFDAATGKLAVAVTDRRAADAVRSVGAQPKLVQRTQSELDRTVAAVAGLAGPGVTSFGVDMRANDVVVHALPGADVLRLSTLDGVRIERVTAAPVQQSGDTRPGNPWWPGGESNCSIGFSATDSSGGKHFVTAGHCTNDANQAAYGESSQRNRIGTSNVGGNRSVNAREGDMGVVAVTEPGWNLSASVNTWGGAPLTVTGVANALVGETVCHSGNTAPRFQCGEVTAVNQTIDYGSVVVEGLTTTTACSEGGDSGGAWLVGDKATGLHSGGQSSCSSPPSDSQSIFQPVAEALAKWQLTLYTGGGGGDDTEAPTAPASPRATGVTATSVTLAWTAATDDVGVTGYDVYRDGTKATTVTGTTATVTGLAPDTSYAFTVRARDAAGNTSAPSTAVTARTQPGAGRTFTNGTDFPLRDFQVAVSPIRSTATGAATSPATVEVTATHPCVADLNISVVSPTGRSYLLQRYGQDGWRCEPFGGARTFRFTPAEQASGTWTLRIGDNGPGDTGVLDTWSLTV